MCHLLCSCMHHFYAPEQYVRLIGTSLVYGRHMGNFKYRWQMMATCKGNAPLGSGFPAILDETQPPMFSTNLSCSPCKLLTSESDKLRNFRKPPLQALLKLRQFALTHDIETTELQFTMVLVSPIFGEVFTSPDRPGVLNIQAQRCAQKLCKCSFSCAANDFCAFHEFASRSPAKAYRGIIDCGMLLSIRKWNVSQ